MRMPRSWLGRFNYLILQWFFVRLARLEDADTGERRGWSLIWGAVPLTGWGTPYRWVRRKPWRATNASR